MVRQLRPRKPAAPVAVATDNEGGPFKMMENEGDSGSEFASEGSADTVADEVEEELAEELREEESVPAPKKEGPLSKHKSKAKSVVNVFRPTSRTRHPNRPK